MPIKFGLSLRVFPGCIKIAHYESGRKAMPGYDRRLKKHRNQQRNTIKKDCLRLDGTNSLLSL